jgi:hypothetical protein
MGIVQARSPPRISEHPELRVTKVDLRMAKSMRDVLRYRGPCGPEILGYVLRKFLTVNEEGSSRFDIDHVKI